MNRPRKSGEAYAWIAILFLAWMVAMWYLLSTMDPSVVCSNSQPC